MNKLKKLSLLLLVISVFLPTCASPATQIASNATMAPEATSRPTETPLPPPVNTATMTPNLTITPTFTPTSTKTEIPIDVPEDIEYATAKELEDGTVVAYDADGQVIWVKPAEAKEGIELTHGFVEVNDAGQSVFIMEPGSIVSPQTEVVPQVWQWPLDQVRVVDGMVEMTVPGMEQEVVVYSLDPSSQELTQYFWQLDFEQQWVGEDGQPVRGLANRSLAGRENPVPEQMQWHVLAGNVVSVERVHGDRGDYILQLAVPVDAAGNYFAIVPIQFGWGLATELAFWQDKVLLENGFYPDVRQRIFNKELLPNLPPGTPLAVELVEIVDLVASLQADVDNPSYHGGYLTLISQYARSIGHPDGCNSVETCLPYYTMNMRELGRMLPEDLAALKDYLASGGIYPLDMVPKSGREAAVGLPKPEEE